MTGPARWPPVSVWAAAGLLLLPWLGATGFCLVNGPRLFALFPLPWLVIVSGPTSGLLRGHFLGFVYVAFPVLIVFGLSPFALVAWLSGAPGSEHLMLLFGPLLGWAACLGALLYWPATRRWCGLLPPDPDDED